jgi:hypothetical protein
MSAAKRHLVGDDQHRQVAGVRELVHHAEHLADELGVER